MDRRRFLEVAAVAGGLAAAISLTGCGAESAPSAAPDLFAPNAWIRIAADGTVTIVVDRSEMGQGVSTALPMLVAEELDADWATVRYQFAPANEAYYNPLMGIQATGGSTAVMAGWEPLRRAGATVRAMLIAAAARQWAVSAGECSTEPGAVVHRGSGRRLGYGVLAAPAAKEPVPGAVVLKEPKDFRLIGTSVPRLDLKEKVTGQAIFGLDAGPRDALVAVVARCPVFGGGVRSFDSTKAMAVTGVRQVLQISSGVAVVAETFWAAEAGRRALEVVWDEGPNAGLDDATISGELERLAKEPGRVAREVAGPPASPAAQVVSATYQVPYLAHATMEPMNCTVLVEKDRVTLWTPTQFQAAPSYLAGGGTRGVAASIAGVPRESVVVHTTHLGGGFGRRSELDVPKEAVEIAKQVGGAVRLVWTREDDTRHDQYRPAARHELRAGLSNGGDIVNWSHAVASQSINAKFMPGFLPEWATRLGGPLKGGIDQSAVEGAVDVPYRVGQLSVRYSRAYLPVPVGFWRSVGHTHTAFAVESFIDELAAQAKQDPVDFRRKHLADADRHRGVLERVALESGWGSPLVEGRARGVAVHQSFGSFAAMVAEVSVDANRAIRVHRVVAALDCGQIVNPDTIRAQVEGSIVYGLSAALKGKISIEKGRVQESNFHDYPVLRMSEMPVVEVHLVASTEAPGGVGEPGTPPIAPAVANAVFAATGQRLRTLPLQLSKT